VIAPKSSLSRAFIRAVAGGSERCLDEGWQMEGRYRYLVSYSSGMAMRMVLGEYLASEVAW
jgi:hypothetical protein